MIKMLIADDEPLIRESLAECFDWGALGIEVAGLCKNGVEALDMIVDTYPNLMLTDIRMPGLSGLELIEKIRERDQDIEVIIISGYQEFDYAKKAIQFGVTDYLLKPIKEPQLMKAIESAKLRLHDRARLRALDKAEKPELDAGIVSQMKAYVEKHYAEQGLTLKWLAENMLFMNVDYVSRKFVTETGEKFSAYLTRIRMERAKELLKDGARDMQRVADRVGCGNSQRYFSQMFKRYEGISPTQYQVKNCDK